MKRFARVRLEMVKEKSLYTEKRFLDTPRKAAEFGRELYFSTGEKGEYRCPCKEMLVTCCVTTKNEPLIVEYTSIGDNRSTIASVKDIYLTSLLSNSPGLLVYHNHPSNVVIPSHADRMIFKKLEDASKILEIDLVDMIIVSEESGFYSFREGKAFPWDEAVFGTAS